MQVCPECDREYGEDVEFCPHDGARVREVAGEEADQGDPLVGRLLDGRWRIEEKFGEGGMGSIYVASQESVGREVAIKTLRTALSDNEEFTERFFREARVTTTISHPHCVTILDYGETDRGTLYLAMELLEGEPLAERMDRERLPLGEILEIGKQIASALAAAHERDIVHRDLKPENIFLLDISDGSTFVKVLDFGISKDLSSEENLTQTGQLFGTPRYMSPEQSRDEEIDGRTDLYSLGCILYEMLAEEAPFTGEKPMSILVAHVQEEVPSLREATSREMPERLVELVMRLLEKDPENRPQTATEVRSILGDILTEYSSGDRRSSGRRGGEAAGRTDVGRAETLASQADVGAAGDGGERIAAADGATPARQSLPERTQRETTSSLEANRGLLMVAVGLVVLGCVAVGGLAVYYLLDGAEKETALAAVEQGDAAGTLRDVGGRERSTDGGAVADGGASSAAVRLEAGHDAEKTPEAGARPEERLARKQSDDESSAGSGGVPSSEEEETAAPIGGNGSSGGGRAGDKADESGGADDGGDETSPPGATESSDERQPSPDPGGGSESSSSDRTATEEESPQEKGGGGGNPAKYVRRASLSVTGPVCNRDDIKQQLDARAGAMGECYESGSAEGTRPAGNVLLEWNIGTDGEVVDPAVLTSSLGEATIEACLVDTVERIQFAAPGAGRCYTRATFTFGQ